MAWTRLIIGVDGRLILAAIGLAAALVLPAATTLVSSGLSPQIDDSTWFLDEPGGIPSDLLSKATIAVAVAGNEAAIVVGDPVVGPGEFARMPLAPAKAGAIVVEAPAIVPLDAYLVHPADFDAPARFALFDEEVPGARLARAADEFEVAGLDSLAALIGWVLLAATVGAMLIAIVYALADTDSKALPAALFASLGRPELGRWVMILRVGWLVSLGTLLAVIGAFGLWQFGGTTFHPPDTPKLRLAISFLVPAAGAFLGGGLAALARLRQPLAILQTGGNASPPSPGLARMPGRIRPLALGTRLVPLLAVTALLFGVDVGLPLAAAAIPAQIAGAPGEWVVGAENGVPGTSTNALPGQVLGLHPDVDAATAEVILPTVVNGVATLVRGADSRSFGEYHKIEYQGDATGALVGQRLAERLNLEVGDVIDVGGRQAGVHARFNVTGVMIAKGAIGDEVLLPLEAGQQLAGLSASEADVMRVRPATPAAQDAMGGSPEIVIAGISVGATRGVLARIDIDAANTGDASATRSATIRVNGEAATTVSVTLGPWQRQTISQWVAVPAGQYRVEVNPTTTGAGQANGWELEVPSIAFENRQFTATLSKDGALATGVGIVVADDADAMLRRQFISQQATDANGEARIALPAGDYVVGLADGRAAHPISIVSAVDQFQSNIQVEAAWSIPAVPQPGKPFNLYVQAFNRGGQTGIASFELVEGELRRGGVDVSLQSGQRDVFTAFGLVGYGNMQIEGIPISIAKLAPPPDKASGIRDGGGVQREAADRVLGDAETAIGGLAAVAIISSVAVVGIGTRRVLQERAYVVDVLLAMGQEPHQVRRRIVIEAGALAAAAGALAVVLAKGMFWVLLAAGGPITFAHVPIDPFSWLVSFQVVIAFVAATILPAHLAAERMLPEGE